MTPLQITCVLRIILTCLIASAGYAQQIASIDTTFNATGIDRENGNGPFSLINFPYIRAHKQSDNKIILTGYFEEINGMNSAYLKRLTPEGKLDTSYHGPTFGMQISHSILLPGNNLIVQGAYSVSSLLRYDINGEIDSSFHSGFGIGGFATCSDYFPDSSFILGGSFSSYDTSSFIGNIVKIKFNGQIDTSFHAGSGFNSSVSQVKVQPDGKILVAGTFSAYKGQPVNPVIRLNPDGSIDNSFSIVTPVSDHVTSLELLTNGKILIAFQNTNPHITYFRRLLANGAVDPLFQEGIVTSGYIGSSHSLDDGSIFISGAYNYNTLATNGFLKLSADGVPDNPFNQTHSCDQAITTFIPVNDSLIFVAGNFKKINNTDAPYYEMIKTTGEIDYSYEQGTGASNSVRTLEKFGNQYFIGGDFSYYNGKPVHRMARINQDGSLDPTFHTGTGFNSTVKDIAFQADNKIVVVGDFTSYNGVQVDKIVRLQQNGQIDPTFTTNFGVPVELRTVTTYFDTVFVGGTFYINQLNGEPAHYYHLARLKMNGQVDTNFHLDQSAETLYGIYDLQALKDSSKLIFSSRGTKGLVRIFTSGAKDETFELGGQFLDSVSTFTMLPNGNYLCAASFASNNAILYRSFCRINHDGSVDPTLQTGSGLGGGPLHKILCQDDGKIVLLGDFTTYKDSQRNRMIRVTSTGNLDTQFNPNTGLNSAIRTGIIQADKKIIAAGDFWTYRNTLVNRIMRIHNTWTDIPVGIDEHGLPVIPSMSLFPNPNNGNFFLTNPGNAGIRNIEVFNLRGMKVEHEFQADSQSIRIEAIPGLYFIRVQTADQRMHHLKFEIF